jgi:flagellar basal-body rod protein FlgB
MDFCLISGGGTQMPGYLFSNSLLMLERAMDYQWTKFSVISDNIVNAETPNYKPKYVTFEEALSASIRSSVRNTDRKGASVRSAILRSQPIVHVAEEESMRMDDNGVNVTEQSTELTRTTYQMNYTMDAINNNLSLLRTLIRGQ